MFLRESVKPAKRARDEQGPREGRRNSGAILVALSYSRIPRVYRLSVACNAVNTNSTSSSSPTTDDPASRTARRHRSPRLLYPSNPFDCSLSNTAETTTPVRLFARERGREFESPSGIKLGLGDMSSTDTICRRLEER